MNRESLRNWKRVKLFAAYHY